MIYSLLLYLAGVATGMYLFAVLHDLARSVCGSGCLEGERGQAEH